MKNSLYKSSAIALICIVGISIIMLIQVADANRYISYIERTWAYVRHIDGDVTGHIVKEDVTYEDHESQGSHQHTTDTHSINAGTYNCPAGSPSQCYFCGPG